MRTAWRGVAQWEVGKGRVASLPLPGRDVATYRILRRRAETRGELYPTAARRAHTRQAGTHGVRKHRLQPGHVAAAIFYLICAEPDVDAIRLRGGASSLHARTAVCVCDVCSCNCKAAVCSQVHGRRIVLRGCNEEGATVGVRGCPQGLAFCLGASPTSPQQLKKRARTHQGLKAIGLGEAVCVPSGGRG